MLILFYCIDLAFQKHLPPLFYRFISFDFVLHGIRAEFVCDFWRIYSTECIKVEYINKLYVI